MPATAPASQDARSVRRPELYHSDEFSWAMQQAEALRRRNFDAIDWDNVIEEIEDVGARHKDKWIALCARTLEHLLAIEHRDRASNSALRAWVGEVDNFRRQIAKVLRRNPGLQGQYAAIFADAWEDARADAVARLAEYEADDPVPAKAVRWRWSQRLPERCPYLLEDVAAFDPRRDREPDAERWPPAVARRLNERLGRNYAAASGPGAVRSRTAA